MRTPRQCFNAESTARELRRLTETIDQTKNVPSFKRVEATQCALEISTAILLHLQGRVCELESRLATAEHSLLALAMALPPAQE